MTIKFLSIEEYIDTLPDDVRAEVLRDADERKSQLDRMGFPSVYEMYQKILDISFYTPHSTAH